MDAHIDARYHVHGQDQPDDAGKLITVKAVRSVWRGPVGKRSRNVTFVGWLPYGEAQVILAGVQQKVQVFVMHLSYSRRTFVMTFPAQKQEAFFYGHVRAFEFFGGIPHRDAAMTICLPLSSRWCRDAFGKNSVRSSLFALTTSSTLISVPLHKGMKREVLRDRSYVDT